MSNVRALRHGPSRCGECRSAFAGSESASQVSVLPCIGVACSVWLPSPRSQRQCSGRFVLGRLTPCQAGLGWRHLPDASARQQHQSVVGAPRRRAAPGSQSVERNCCHASGTLRRFQTRSIHVQATKHSAGRVRSLRVYRQRPNLSIEGTSTSKLRLLAAAPHVKR